MLETWSDAQKKPKEKLCLSIIGMMKGSHVAAASGGVLRGCGKRRENKKNEIGNNEESENWKRGHN